MFSLLPPQFQHAFHAFDTVRAQKIGSTDGEGRGIAGGGPHLLVIAGINGNSCLHQNVCELKDRNAPLVLLVKHKKKPGTLLKYQMSTDSRRYMAPLLKHWVPMHPLTLEGQSLYFTLSAGVDRVGFLESLGLKLVVFWWTADLLFVNHQANSKF